MTSQAYWIWESFSSSVASYLVRSKTT